MKKFVSLFLALLMMASVMSVGASAAFTDEASFTYPEAVAKIAELGIVGGYGDGSFGAKGTLSRGAAAKIITGLMLSADEIAALPKGADPYPDVKADSTFGPYISYLKEKGVIGGYADGTFKPSNDLSAMAFLKMLLGALGYSAETEVYYGELGSANILSASMLLGLSSGRKGFLSADSGCTREEAALYVFNALECETVEYKDGAAVGTGKTFLEVRFPEVAAAKYAATLVEPNDVPMLDWMTECGIKANGSAVTRFNIPEGLEMNLQEYHFLVEAANGHKMEQKRTYNGSSTWKGGINKEIGCKIDTRDVSDTKITWNNFEQSDIGSEVNVTIRIICADASYSVKTTWTLGVVS